MADLDGGWRAVTACSPLGNTATCVPLNRRTRMAVAPEEINADMLAFWNGKGGDIWVARQEHTDITLAPVTDALLAFAAPRAGGGCLCAWQPSRAPVTPPGICA